MRKGKQMTATIAGAPSHNKVNWNAIDWQKANRNVNRLQARIVKATQYLLNVTVSFNGHLEGLSRMRGNSHVRFLGEGAAATPPPYPTKGRKKNLQERERLQVFEFQAATRTGSSIAAFRSLLNTH